MKFLPEVEWRALPDDTVVVCSWRKFAPPRRYPVGTLNVIYAKTANADSRVWLYERCQHFDEMVVKASSGDEICPGCNDSYLGHPLCIDATEEVKSQVLCDGSHVAQTRWIDV